jgi:hypothetical protein
VVAAGLAPRAADVLLARDVPRGASAAGPAGPFEAALAGFTDVAAHTVSAIRLIRLGRDDHLWEWDVCATVPLARP